MGSSRSRQTQQITLRRGKSDSSTSQGLQCSCPMSSLDSSEIKLYPPAEESCHSVSHGSSSSSGDDDEDFKGAPWTRAFHKKLGPKPPLRPTSSSQSKPLIPNNEVPFVFEAQRRQRKQRRSRRGRSTRFGASVSELFGQPRRILLEGWQKGGPGPGDSNSDGTGINDGSTPQQLMYAGATGAASSDSNEDILFSPEKIIAY